MPARGEPATTITPAFEARRAEIVEVAAQLFDREGYGGTNIQTIAAAAGLHKSTMYHYFRSKTELLVQIHNDFMELLFDQLNTVPRDEVPPDERLRSVVEHILGLMKTRRPYVRTFFEHYRELPSEERKAVGTKRRRYERAVIEMITDGIAQGVFRPVDPYYAAMTVFGSCNWAYQWFGRSGDLNAASEAIWDIVSSGLRA
jgi:AcrR family transcriptional regulator